MSAPTDGLHPQAQAHLAGAGPGVAAMTVPEVRRSMAGYRQLQRARPEVPVEHHFVPGPTADLPIRIIRPEGAGSSSPFVVVLHGSGWVAATLEEVEEPARVLALDTGLVVVTVFYQKAPEHPFPIPLQDCLATVDLLLEHADDLGLDPDRFALVGDSAGGNLAAAVTAELVDRGTPPAAQALLYPALRHPGLGRSESYRLFGTGYGLDAADMEWFWGHYVDAHSAADPRVSPAMRTSFRGFPPTLVATAECDVLRDEAEQYAAALTADGVAVRASRHAGMIHGFWWMDGVLDGSRELQLELAHFLRDELTGAAASGPRSPSPDR